MLVLSRKVGEILKIGDAVQIKVLEVRGRKAKLGVIAPDDVRVRRGELKPSERNLREAGA